MLANAILLDDGQAPFHNALGLVLQAQRKLDAALLLFQRAIALDREFADAHNNLGNMLEASGRISDALTAYRQALEVDPGFSGAHSNLLLGMQYDAGTDALTAFAEHEDWNTVHAARYEQRELQHANVPVPTRRLRIGYVSADLCQHPVASFFEPILTEHDAETVEVYCYSNTACEDEVTDRLRRSASYWRSIRSVPDEQVADMIRADGIDILVDLAGHTAGNRLLVFARKPAPIQVTYLGYPGTTGLRAMDYRLTDHWTDPPGVTESLYVEELVRLPNGSLCFHPPPSTPEPRHLPGLSSDCINFASFNNSAKLSPDAISLWARVLAAVPQSRLILKSKSIDNDNTVQRLAELFGKHGIARDRLEFIQWIPEADAHLAVYNSAHIALDTFPYSGCTTTCEALWMGVPVITLARDEPRSRMSLSVIAQVGLDDCIAPTPEAFVDIAQALATDIGRLKAMRTTLRTRMRQSSLLDAESFTRDLESAYRDMWVRYLNEN